MNIMITKYAPFVKEQIDYHTRVGIVKARRGDEVRARASDYRAEKFQELLRDLEGLHDPTITPTSSLTLTPTEIRDLPEELLNELSVTESDRRDFMIVDMIEKNGGVSTIDKLLIGIYKDTGEIEKRVRLTARLYRMAKKGLIYPHPHKKGVYSTTVFPIPDSTEPEPSGDEEEDDQTL